MSTTDDLATGNAPESGGWRFDDAVSEAFDDMLSRSIPQYDVMRRVVTNATCWFADAVSSQCGRSPSVIVDLGTSRGSALAPIVERLGTMGRYCAYEISDPMIEIARERFATEIGRGHLEVIKHDLREGYPARSTTRMPRTPVATVLSILTIQFTPIEYRQKILRGIYQDLTPGGALVWVEKVLGATAELDALEVDLYYGYKRDDGGYTQEAIDRKRLSLEGVLVPLTAAFNEELLRQAGFRQVDCIWAYLNFRCWVAVKG